MSGNPIDFSVVIPTYNRPEQLRSCLTALSKQQYPKQAFEVIIVNDGGTALDEVIKPFQNELTIALIYQQNSGPALARNKGAAIAKGDFLAFTDDDCCCGQDWLQQLAKHCSQKTSRKASQETLDKATVMIGGRTLNSLTNNLYAVASQMIVDLAYQYFNPQPEKARFFASNNMTIPREQFLKIGGFHSAFRTSEDRELCDRWLRSGHRMKYVSEVTIYHAHHLDLFTFWQQQRSYGQGAFRYHAILMERGDPPFRADFSFQAQLLAHPFKALPLHRALFIIGLFGLSQVAGLVGYQQEKLRSTQSIGEADDTLSLSYPPEQLDKTTG